MRLASWILAPAVATALLAGGTLQAAEGEKKATKELPSFGILRAPAPEQARSQAQDWLRGVGKTDETTIKEFDAVWSSDRTLLDKVTATLELGDPVAKKLLDEARDPAAPAPQAVPDALKDAKRSAFFKANLSLAYAKELSNRRIDEEGLTALKNVKPENVVDPSSYLFYKAVAEHALLLKTEADDTILRLLDDVVDAPERHKMVAALMHFDMRQWRDKDLGWITRKMGNIERRLDLSRGGPKTQKMQKEVVMRLDEIIKQLEKQDDGNGGC